MRMSRSSASECSLSAGGVVALQQMADVQQQVKVEHHGHAHGHAHHLNAVSGLWASANTSSSVMAAANMAQAQDVTNLQYMDLEEFFLDHLTPVDNSRGVFAEPYQISLEQRHHDAAVNMIVSSSPSSTSSSASPPTQSFAQMHHMLSPSSAQPVQGSQNSMLPMSPVQSVQSIQSVQGSQKHVLLQQHDLVGVDLDAKLLPPIRTLARTQSVQDNTAHKSSPHSHSRRLSHQSEMPRRTSSSSLSTPPESPESFDSSDHSSRLGVASPVGNEPGARPRKAVKRSRKESVPEESKDEKYWKRRAKNNEAAKRSRDLRREKENQIMTRVNMLERENQLLSQQLRSVRSDNDELRKRLQKYEVLSI